MPPLTLIAWPVILAASGLARNTIIGATSAGVGTPSRARDSAFSNTLRLNSPDITRAYDFVSRTIEGVITFARMPNRDTSSARQRINMIAAAFAAPMSVSPGVAILPASEATATIAPLPCTFITGTTQ
jgi:hypothetical protein